MRKTISGGVLAAAAVLLLLAAASCGPAGGGAREEVGGEAQIYTGKLKSGFVAGGGEHTGWMLLRGGKEPDLEADVSAVLSRAKELEGTKVKARGTFYEKVYVERGAVKILKIDTLQPAPQ
jgi:hypothetical protein